MVNCSLEEISQFTKHFPLLVTKKEIKKRRIKEEREREIKEQKRKRIRKEENLKEEEETLCQQGFQLNILIFFIQGGFLVRHSFGGENPWKGNQDLCFLLWA